MSSSLRRFALDAMSGQRRGLSASLYRAATSAAMLPYGAVVRVRNALYDREILPRQTLGRPAISVGNLTTGGTGKTPTVAWLVETLASRGQRVAVLLRGYGARDPQQGDEARELRLRFASLASSDAPVEVIANADRVAAARRLLQRQPDIDAFVLDDGFQHRRARRDFDLVLIDVTCPFGFGRLLPRGLLREPLSSLRRADAVLLTRCDLVDREELDRITDVVRLASPDLPVFRSRHALQRLSDGRPLECIVGQTVDVFCGIGNPDAFRSMLTRAGVRIARFEAFDDHHEYSDDELRRLSATRSRGAFDRWLTTMKDLARLGPRAATLPAVGVTMDVSFEDDDEARLLALIESRLGWQRA